MTTMFFLCVAAMLAGALAFVLLPLLRHGRSAGSAAAMRQSRALDEALAAGVIDAEEHARKRAALAPAPDARTRSRAAFVAVLLIALLLPASALLLYRFVGTPQALDPANLVTAPGAGGEAGPDMGEAIAMLSARLEEKPDDIEGWILLARAYQSTGREADALAALKRAHDAAPEHPVVTVEYAQALAMTNPERRIVGEARTLLERALRSDASNQRALWLLGISDYQAGNYDAAIARWNTLLPLLEPGSTVADSVKQQIADATARRDGTATAQAAATPPAAAGQVPATPAGDAPRLVVEVSLDPKLTDKLDPDATLFVFARAPSGPPMPLAIERLRASQLPLTVTLDDSKGMLPDMKLSMFPQVVIGARVSKSGDATPSSGDFEVLSAPIDVLRREPLKLAIDRIVP
ncbi:MAG: c-type cytochrome biogenesis protein CcmI [Lysobacteraceae bacterium]|nr:MAG: c-type cytochrome biogenesis protein CcmI [Xanthomonadaceae bacterium]